MINLKYFSLEEFNCSHTGENKMVPEFLEAIDQLREDCGFSFVITSGYRSPKHPIEARKTTPGTHAQGIACDIKVTTGDQRYTLVSKALEYGFKGIGIAKDFIHVDARLTTPVIWTYS